MILVVFVPTLYEHLHPRWKETNVLRGQSWQVAEGLGRDIADEWRVVEFGETMQGDPAIAWRWVGWRHGRTSKPARWASFEGMISQGGVLLDGSLGAICVTERRGCVVGDDRSQVARDFGRLFA